MLLKQTNHTPYVELTQNSLNFYGESRPENSADFYLPICKKLELMLKDLGDGSFFKAEFKLEYVSSSSMLFLKQLFTVLKKFQLKLDCKIIWNYFELDEDMKETGETFEILTGVEIKYVSFGN
jgi:hypothetical protein